MVTTFEGKDGQCFYGVITFDALRLMEAAAHTNGALEPLSSASGIAMALKG